MGKIVEKTTERATKLSEKIINKLRVVVLPGFDGMPLYDVLVFFFRGLFKGVLTYRAAAISYNFFLAMVPLVLFLFTLIPYVTSESLQGSLMEIINELMPSNIFAEVQSTIVEIISRPKKGLMSLGFVMSIYFATNGVDAILEGFNQSYHRIKTWPWWMQKIYAFLLMVVISFLGIISTLSLTFGKVMITSLSKFDIINDNVIIYLLFIIQWIVIILMSLLSVSLLYYYGQKKDKNRNYRFLSVGSIFATGLFIIGGLIIKAYFENFSNYNVLYGSLGTLIILMVWIYYNAIILLIGFELNTSIQRSKEISDHREQMNTGSDSIFSKKTNFE